MMNRQRSASTIPGAVRIIPPPLPPPTTFENAAAGVSEMERAERRERRRRQTVSTGSSDGAPAVRHTTIPNVAKRWLGRDTGGDKRVQVQPNYGHSMAAVEEPSELSDAGAVVASPTATIVDETPQARAWMARSTEGAGGAAETGGREQVRSSPTSRTFPSPSHRGETVSSHISRNFPGPTLRSRHSVEHVETRHRGESVSEHISRNFPTLRNRHSVDVVVEKKERRETGQQTWHASPPLPPPPPTPAAVEPAMEPAMEPVVVTAADTDSGAETDDAQRREEREREDRARELRRRKTDELRRWMEERKRTINRASI
ncbi:hypothetical protein EDC01DRAFT_636177 [Geopyxis carbonaria]|nr:hypothetical protein EDC01DRAFT_636177 [Geopyxis carbonaria]